MDFIAMKLSRAVAAVILLISSTALAQSPSTVLHRLFRKAFEQHLRDYPVSATYFGRDEFNDRWTDLSPEAIERRKQSRRELLAEARAIDRSALNSVEQLNYDLFLADLNQRVLADQFPDELLAVDPLFNGPIVRIPNAIAIMPAGAVKDYENIIARLRNGAAYVEQTIALLEEGKRMGITQPAVILRDVPAQADKLASGDPSKSALLQAFRRFPSSISAGEQARLAKEAAAALDGALMPAFRKLKSYLEEDYIPACRQTIARTALPGGKEWYAADIREHTTTALTARQIHDIGQAEVRRIRAEMDAILGRLDFTGGMPAFLKFLRGDPRFYFSDAAALLTAYRDICKRIDPELPRLFGKLPRTPYGVIPVGDHLAPSETSARYRPCSADGRRPGYFVANTWRLDMRPKYEMEALALHESVPGHHLQIALAMEMQDVPEFRKIMDVTAFTEGWGLYAESLGEELGFYKDPYSKFGQLSFEMWRACRLVVDTGMHALGWTRQQAIDFMLAHTASTGQNVVVEVDRYIAWPGQALAYKLGELKIKELRRYAEQQLGPAFDVRAFHDHLLAEGPLPLDTLEVRMKRWAADVQKSRRNR